MTCFGAQYAHYQVYQFTRKMYTLENGHIMHRNMCF
jgi:hypothetical protein